MKKEDVRERDKERRRLGWTRRSKCRQERAKNIYKMKSCTAKVLNETSIRVKSETCNTRRRRGTGIMRLKNKRVRFDKERKGKTKYHRT